MILPHVDDPTRLRGLYVYDFGDWTAIGYTAEEIAILLDDESWRGGKIYKIHRATPDGQMELRGVSPTRFNVESGMFFCRRELDAARADFEERSSIWPIARSTAPSATSPRWSSRRNTKTRSAAG